MVWSIGYGTKHTVRQQIVSSRKVKLTEARALTKQYPESKLKVYITGDGSDVYEDAFTKVAKNPDGAFTPTLVLVGIRLGIDRVTPVYWEALKASLMMPQSIGIAGYNHS